MSLLRLLLSLPIIPPYCLKCSHFFKHTTGTNTNTHIHIPWPGVCGLRIKHSTAVSQSSQQSNPDYMKQQQPNHQSNPKQFLFQRTWSIAVAILYTLRVLNLPSWRVNIYIGKDYCIILYLKCFSPECVSLSLYVRCVLFRTVLHIKAAKFVRAIKCDKMPNAMNDLTHTQTSSYL